MSNDKWKEPFRELRTKLYGMHRANAEIYHGVALFPYFGFALYPTDEHCLEVCSEWEERIEANSYDRKIVRCEETPGGWGSRHVHYFSGANFGRTHGSLLQLENCVMGMEAWVKKIPQSLIPRFTIPQYSDQATRDLIQWVSLVYYLALELKTPYLDAFTECNQLDADYLAGWSRWPQPGTYDPGPMMIHLVDPHETIEKWKEEFLAASEVPGDAVEYRLPEMIDTYLVNHLRINTDRIPSFLLEPDLLDGNPLEISMVSNLITASVTAIDCLLYMWVPMRREQQQTREGKPRQKRKPADRVSDEVTLLKVFLNQSHVDEHSRRKIRSRPLTCTEIAEALKWYRKDGEPDQVKVTRRMELIYGPKPMTKYGRIWTERNGRGFSRSVRDRTLGIDPENDDENEDNSDE